MRKFASIWIILLCYSTLSFAQVVLLQQDKESISIRISDRIESTILDWFFEKGILALSEQTTHTAINLELAQYMAQQMRAQAMILWSMNEQGNFSLIILGKEGQRLGEMEAQFVLAEASLENKVLGQIEPLLSNVMKNLNLL